MEIWKCKDEISHCTPSETYKNMVAKCKVNHGIFLAQSNPIVILTIGIRPW
jgi:hypothetical protein